MKKKEVKNLKNIVKIVSTIITIVIVLLILLVILNYSSIKNSSSTLVQIYGIPALFFVSLILDLIPIYISPVAALATSMIAGIPAYIAIPTTIIGSTIGSIIGFAIGKKYMFNAINVLASEETVEKITHLTNKYGKIIIALAAISPVPYLAIAFGTINFSNKNFLIYGLIPRALSFLIYGLFLRSFYFL